MRAQPRQGRLIAGALGIAVVAGLIGFLVSRPRTPLVPLRPTPLTTVAAPMGPPTTAGYSVADDIATQQVVVFGGIADNQATWLWSGGRGSLAPAAAPPALPAGSTRLPPTTLRSISCCCSVAMARLGLISATRGPGAARTGGNSTAGPHHRLLT